MYCTGYGRTGADNIEIEFAMYSTRCRESTGYSSGYGTRSTTHGTHHT
jgi:hypothetical protein